ncbi:MAG: CotH kinase family protein [Acidimicrobiales bacterium]
MSRASAAMTVLVVALIAAACGSSSESTQPSTTTTVTTPTSLPPVNCDVDPPQQWVVEGEAAMAVIDCGDRDLAVVAAPAGVAVGDGTVEWTPGLDQAGVHHIVLEGDGGSARWTVGVADAFAEPGNVPVVDPLTLTHEYGLEVMHLFTDDALSTEYTDASLTHGGHRYDAEIRIRGALSLQYPKPNFTVRLGEPFRSDDPAFDGLDRLVLVAGFDDNSALRNRLAQQLWSDIDDRHLDVPHGSVVVYLDGAYVGLYTVLENVNDEYLGRHQLDPAGQLFKGNDARADFRLDDPDPAAGFEKKSGAPEDGPAAFGPIADLVEFAATSSDDRFVAEVDQWVDTHDVIDWFVFVSFISAGDSANKNAYWYQSDAGDAFRYVPWDFNHSFGQDFLTVRRPADTDLPLSFLAMNGLFERFWADPDLRRRVIVRYGELLAGPLAPAALGATIDTLVADIDLNLARNEQRWGSTHEQFRLWSDRPDINTGTGEIDYIRQWIVDRHAVVAAEVAEL